MASAYDENVKSPIAMKKSVNYIIVRLGTVAAMLIVSLMLMDKLPETVPTHWDINGVVDANGSKYTNLYLLPGIGVVLFLLFPLLAAIDPRRKNYDKFRPAWEMIQTIIILFLAYVHFIVLYLSLHQDKSGLMPSFMFAGLGVMFALLGHYMMQVKQNYFVGLRTPWTLDDPEVWEKSHKFTGKVFMVAGLLMFLQAWFQIQMFPGLIGIIVLTALLPVIHSYVIWRKRH